MAHLAFHRERPELAVVRREAPAMSPAPSSARVTLTAAEPRLASALAGFLASHGLEVAVERDAELAVARAAATVPDLVILDVATAGADGLDACRRLREHFGGAILVVGASRADDDHVTALELGADDYVVKPVEPRVLLARIRALLRRMRRTGVGAEPPSGRLAVGGLALDRELRLVHVGDRAVDLTGSEFSLLWLLAEHTGQSVTREALHTAALGTRWSPLDRGLDAHVSRIRRKLEAAGLDGAVIQSVRGEGYRLLRRW